MGLSDGEIISMIRSAVLIQYTRVTDRQTDGIGVAYTRYSMLSRVKRLKLRTAYSSSSELCLTAIWGVTCYMGSYSFTCHPTQVNVPLHNIASELVHDLPTPEGWKAELT